MQRHVVVAFMAAVLLLGTSVSGALAHANLLRSNIKNYQVFRLGHAPRMITAFFAEELDPKPSWMAVFEGEADHGLVNERQHSVVNFKNPKEMTLRLPKLDRGKFYLIWYTRSTEDNHYAAGVIYFSVK